MASSRSGSSPQRCHVGTMQARGRSIAQLRRATCTRPASSSPGTTSSTSSAPLLTTGRRAEAAQRRVAAALRVAASTVGRGVGRGVGLGVGALSATGAGVRFVRRRRRPSPPWHVPMPYAARHAFLKLQSSSTSHSRSWFVHLPFLRGVAGAAAASGGVGILSADGSVPANGALRSSLSDCAPACSSSAAADTTLSMAAPRIAAQRLEGQPRFEGQPKSISSRTIRPDWPDFAGGIRPWARYLLVSYR